MEFLEVGMRKSQDGNGNADCGLEKAEEFDSGFRHPSLPGRDPDILWIF